MADPFSVVIKDKQVMVIRPWLIFFFDASGMRYTRCSGPVGLTGRVSVRIIHIQRISCDF